MLGRAETVRDMLEPHFSATTAADQSSYHGGSHGHCAVVALVFRMLGGGELVSAVVDGVSHWFNRIDGYDIDLTGDQFGKPRVQSAPAGSLYVGARIRQSAEVKSETLRRAAALLLKASGG